LYFLESTAQKPVTQRKVPGADSNEFYFSRWSQGIFDQSELPSHVTNHSCQATAMWSCER